MRREARLCVLIWAAVAISVAGIVGRAVSSARLPESSAVDAAALFNSKCAKCHGRDGRSKTTRGRFTHARDLSKADWQDDVSDERIFNSISNGKGKMPSFKKNLSENQIESLVTYVRRLRN